MIIKHKVRIPSDTRGKIKSGIKTPKGLPQGVGWFNISKFPELVEAYGEQPTVLAIVFPSDRITDFYDSNFELWKRRKKGDNAGKGLLLRSCDGANCIHRVDESVQDKEEKTITKFKAGESTLCTCEQFADRIADNQRCSYVCRFSAWIVDPRTGKPENPLCYRFEAGFNSGENVLSGLEFVKPLTEGRLLGVPFYLSVTMVESKKEAGRKFPVWSLRPTGMMTQINKMLGTVTGMKPLMLDGHTEERKVETVIDQVETKIAMCQNRNDLVKLYEATKSDTRIATDQWEDLDKKFKAKAATFPKETR